LAKPNYSYQKRQKELAKQKKAEEKRLRKLEKRSGSVAEEPVEPATDDGVDTTADESTSQEN